MVFKSKAVKEERGESQNSAMTFISKGSEVKGDIHTAGNLRVDGTVHGNVRALRPQWTSARGWRNAAAN